MQCVSHSKRSIRACGFVSGFAQGAKPVEFLCLGRGPLRCGLCRLFSFPPTALSDMPSRGSTGPLDSTRRRIWSQEATQRRLRARRGRSKRNATSGRWAHAPGPSGWWTRMEPRRVWVCTTGPMGWWALVEVSSLDEDSMSVLLDSEEEADLFGSDAEADSRGATQDATDWPTEGSTDESEADLVILSTSEPATPDMRLLRDLKSRTMTQRSTPRQTDQIAKWSKSTQVCGSRRT